MHPNIQNPGGKHKYIRCVWLLQNWKKFSFGRRGLIFFNIISGFGGGEESNQNKEAES